MDNIKALIENLLEDIKDVDKKKIKRKINKDHIKANINLDLGEKNDGYFVSKLRLTGNLMDVPSQVKSQSLKLYINFARLSEKNLKMPKTTYLYNQLYVLARDYVEDFIDPYHEKKAMRIYRNLTSLTHENLEPILNVEADKFFETFPALNREVIDFYNLTACGKVVVFWDPDGSLREKYKFAKDEERALLQLGQRRNVLWESPSLSALTINLFLQSLKLVFRKDGINSEILKIYSRPYTLSKNLLDSLLIITEANVRNYFSFLADIKTQKAIDLLIENHCDDILIVFMEYQLAYLDNLKDSKIEEIYLGYLKENPHKSSDIASFIASLSLDRQVAILKSFEDGDNYREILDNLLKDDFTPIKVLALYHIFRNKMEKTKDKKALFEIIRQENFEEFLKLVMGRDFDIDLISEILELRKVKAKRIKLNKKLVKKSRQDLSKTVETINDFVGGEENQVDDEIGKDTNISKEADIKSPVDNMKLSRPSIKLLKKIIQDGYISKDEANDLALEDGLFLNVFVNNINDVLYEYTNDQTLAIEGNSVFIDEFYEQMIKELIDG